MILEKLLSNKSLSNW